jgi:hypothetical protein
MWALTALVFVVGPSNAPADDSDKPAADTAPKERAAAQQNAKDSENEKQPEEANEPEIKLGLHVNDARACQAYTLVAPLQSKSTYLIDMDGRIVKTWECECTPMVAVLLENGNLFRPGSLMGEEESFGGGPGASGRIQEFTWDGEVVWDYRMFNDKQLAHHEATKLPNGNVLMIVWDKKTAEEAIAAGRRPETVRDSYLLPDSLVEVKPTGKTTGEIVWEWHVWDHLIQDHDRTKANYGNVAEHPELVDLNYGRDMIGRVMAAPGGAQQLQAIGYVGANNNRSDRRDFDWTHFNAVAYNPDLDQVVVSVHTFSEIWIIDHSTTSAEAASHKGGRSGKGGDLLYRWGNPEAYRAGTSKDRTLFAQHNAHWIPKGYPGAGNLLLFNNAHESPDGSYSTVDEIELPVSADGSYQREPGKPFGPSDAVWSYKAPKPSDFYSSFISGAHRLPNGNTVMCTGASGTIYEVTPEKEIVWKYQNPTKDQERPQRNAPGDQSLTIGQLLPRAVQNALDLSSDQRNQIDRLQDEVNLKLEAILNADQRRRLAEMRQGRGLPDQIAVNPGPPPGQGGPNLGPPGRGPNLGPPGRGRGPDRPAGPPRGGGGPTGSSLFRAYRYGLDFPGLADKVLKPGQTLVEVAEAKDKARLAKEAEQNSKDAS